MVDSTFIGPDAYPDAVVDVDLEDASVTLGREGVLAGRRWRPDGWAFVITAYNPGRAASPEENASAQERLFDYLAGEHLTWLAAVGRSRDGRHREPSVVVEGIDAARAIEIARRFGQDAIFSWDGRELRVVDCATPP